MLQFKIAALQAELAKEEVALQDEESTDRERKQRQELRNIEEERDYLLVLRQAQRDEASITAHTIVHLEDELKSLCAIVRMAQGEE